MTPVIAIVVPSTTMLMMKELQVQFLAILNWQDWNESTCFQFEDNVCSWMMATVLPRNIFHLLDGPWINVSAMEQSTTLV